MGITFTVLLPVNRPPAMLPHAIDSVLAQERGDFELIVICDGAPPATVECARGYAERDPRVLVRAHPKGERIGEAYRHQALAEARGACVCQIADDDLWLPNHLGEIQLLLRDFEFGNLPEIHVWADDSLHFVCGDLAIPAVRETMRLKRYNFFAPTAAGYRLSTYRRLPEGWAPGPAELWSDLHMWRKFLALPDLVCGTRMAFTTVHFPATLRRDWTLARRGEEVRRWAQRLLDPVERDRIAQRFFRQLLHSEMKLQVARKKAQV